MTVIQKRDVNKCKHAIIIVGAVKINVVRSYEMK